MNTEQLLNDFAFRSFRDEGDSDYVAARMCFRAAITPSPRASLQMLEKCLKCILLLNRIPKKDVGHDLRRAFDLVDSSAKDQLDLTPDTKRFIEHIAMFGQYRYFEVSRYLDTANIVRLDRAAWELR